MVEALALTVALVTSSVGLLLAILLAGMVSRRAIADQRSTTEALARELGLDVHGTDVIVGRYDGHDVHQYAISDGIRGPSTETRVVVRGGLPRGLVVDRRPQWSSLGGIDLAGELRLPKPLRRSLVAWAVDAATTYEVLADPDVIERFLASWKDGCRAVLREDRVILVRRHVHARGRRAALAAAVRLARALEWAMAAPYWRLAEARGLSIADDGASLSGTVDGLALTVRVVHGDPGHTEVVAVFDPALPWGTSLRAGAGGAVRLGDPVLDALLAVTTPDPDAVATRVARDEVRGPLLEVLHGHPGSEVADCTIRLVAQGRLRAELDAKVDLVLTLARGLAETAEGGLPKPASEARSL